MTEEQVKAFWAVVEAAEEGNLTVRCWPVQAFRILASAKTVSVRAWGHCAYYHEIRGVLLEILLDSLDRMSEEWAVVLVCFPDKEAVLFEVDEHRPMVSEVLEARKEVV